ncbi:unnamed protein product [Calicophoron daubneyi]|uniref:DAZ-associated protein 2 n=1 Tax=Calicophoron daubneyi TaxID=300641 RepID=A0AAV2SZD0_CALDB
MVYEGRWDFEDERPQLQVTDFRPLLGPDPVLGEVVTSPNNLSVYIESQKVPIFHHFNSKMNRNQGSPPYIPYDASRPSAGIPPSPYQPVGYYPFPSPTGVMMVPQQMYSSPDSTGTALYYYPQVPYPGPPNFSPLGAQTPQHGPPQPAYSQQQQHQQQPIFIPGVQYDAGARFTPQSPPSIPPPPPGYQPNLAQQMSQAGYQVQLQKSTRNTDGGWTFW